VSVVVNVTDDEVHEKNETFFGSLKTSNLTPDNVLTRDPSMAVGTIIDDDDLSKKHCVRLLVFIGCGFVVNFTHTLRHIFFTHAFWDVSDVLYYFFAAVRFLTNSSSALESDGTIAFTVMSVVESDNPFTIQVCTRDSDPVSAEGLLIKSCYKTYCLNPFIKS